MKASPVTEGASEFPVTDSPALQAFAQLYVEPGGREVSAAPPAPEGPFGPRQPLWPCTLPLEEPSAFCYAAKAHPEFARGGAGSWPSPTTPTPILRAWSGSPQPTGRALWLDLRSAALSPGASSNRSEKSMAHHPIAATCLAALVLLAGGCARKPEPELPLVSQVREALAQREQRVVSYRYHGVTEQGGEKGEFRFAFRAPSRMRGDFRSARRTFAFDGRRFVQWDEANRLFTEVDLSATPREQAALFLHKVFAPFVPEGFRTPLLGGTLTAETRREGDRPVVAIHAAAESAGERAVITFLLAPPAMDYLGKSVEGGGAARVVSQHCDPALKLCFPVELEETVPGMPPSRTRLTSVEINPALPPEYFELRPPPGVERQVRSGL